MDSASSRSRGAAAHHHLDIQSHRTGASKDGSYTERNANTPAVTWFDGAATEIESLEELLALADECRDSERRAVCVVEDIDKAFVQNLAQAWDIDSSFFDHHSRSLYGNAKEAWSALFPEDKQPVVDQSHSKYKHVDGMFEYHYLRERAPLDARLPYRGSPFLIDRNSPHRGVWVPSEPYSPFSHTMISYCRVHPWLYLFLVDAPLWARRRPNPSGGKIHPSEQDQRRKTDLRVQFSTTRNGVLIPQLLRLREYSLYQVLYSVFKHGWHLNILFDNHIDPHCAIQRSDLLVLMISSLWQTNLQAVDEEIKSVSFSELRKPDMSTNAKLLNLREVLSNLAAGAKEVYHCIPTSVREFYGTVYRDCGSRDRLDFRTPEDKLDRIQADAADLQRFLMDSFQLLMSSISIIETQNGAEQNKISMEQAARGAKLTQLAFIYVPLSFVTSIFGMNIKEVNDSPLSVWVCFVALVIVAVATAGVFGGYEAVKMYEKRQDQVKKASSNAVDSVESCKQQRDVEKAWYKRR